MGHTRPVPHSMSGRVEAELEPFLLRHRLPPGTDRPTPTSSSSQLLRSTSIYASSRYLLTPRRTRTYHDLSSIEPDLGMIHPRSRRSLTRRLGQILALADTLQSVPRVSTSTLNTVRGLDRDFFPDILSSWLFPLSFDMLDRLCTPTHRLIDWGNECDREVLKVRARCRCRCQVYR